MRFVNVAALAVAVACAHAQPPPEPAAKKEAAPAPPPAPPPAPAEAATAPSIAPVSIYFEYDSAEVKPGARAAIDAFYREVEKQPAVRVRIEGNCDERGTGEYNIALGQRRADAARKYLEKLGLDPSRSTAVSNGKEKPRASGHEEDSWRENRRADLVVESQQQ